MHIIESFRARLDSGEVITIHQIPYSGKDADEFPGAGKRYVTDQGETAHEMLSGEFIVMHSGHSPEWARRAA